MADPVRGKLVWQGTGPKRVRRVIFPTRKGMSIPTPFDADQLAASLRNRSEDEIEVELEVVSGKPVRIRPVGEPFAAAPVPQPAPPPRQQRGRRPEGQPQRREQGTRTPEPAFHNPYNFVPALPRDRVVDELGDREPLGLHVLHADHYSGVLRVKMTVKTPLLLPDAAQVADVGNDHKSFPVRVDADGKPYIPPTSIKGMLRAAYEAVTNSRLAVFVGHHTRLQFRKWNPKTKSAPKVDHPVAPCELLPESLQPAYWIDKLSPADRVFGWVRQSDQQREKTRSNVDKRIRAIKAYRGNVRIGPVTCKSNNAIESFGNPGLPLAILGQPKPQQARFYIAKNQNGEAQDQGLTKEQAGYRPGKGLRGRKVYPHHRALPENHWQEPQNDQRYRDVAGSRQAREYIRHPDSRDGQGQPNRLDNQNRSIQGWVKPDTVFTFDLHVTNLSKVELGALLWLLSLPENHYHRFGGGKPLGFGSVRLELDPQATHLPDGNGWKHVYSTLDEVSPSETDRAALIEEFKQAVRTSYPPAASFENVPFIAAWLRMATGHQAPQGSDRPLPTHYPRVSVQPDPAGENFRWFTANESGRRVSLSDLATDAGLPRYDGQ